MHRPSCTPFTPSQQWRCCGPWYCLCPRVELVRGRGDPPGLSQPDHAVSNEGVIQTMFLTPRQVPSSILGLVHMTVLQAGRAPLLGTSMLVVGAGSGGTWWVLSFLKVHFDFACWTSAMGTGRWGWPRTWKPRLLFTIEQVLWQFLRDAIWVVQHTSNLQTAYGEGAIGYPSKSLHAFTNFSDVFLTGWAPLTTVILWAGLKRTTASPDVSWAPLWRCRHHLPLPMLH